MELPPDPTKWFTHLFARLSCRERAFQHRILPELTIHRDAVLSIYQNDCEGTDDLLEGLSSAIAHARKCLEDVGSVWHTVCGSCPLLDKFSWGATS